MKVVQIGACWGDDHVTRLVNGNDVGFILLVEPNQLTLPSLRECYKNQKNCFIEQVAVGLDDTESIRLYYSTVDGPKYEVSSIDKNHILKHGLPEDSIRHFDVLCKRLDTLLDSYNIKELDYLFLDIEGIDAEIILDFNPSKYNIKRIQIEMLHLGGLRDAVLNHLSTHGYEMTDGIDLYGYDKMFVKK